MIDKINNAVCFVFFAALFAMISNEFATHKGMTHSGTQANCPIHSSIHPDCHK